MKKSRARSFLMKVIKIRKHIIREGKSRKNEMRMHKLIQELTAWVYAWPNASEAQVINYIRNKEQEIIELIPGEGCQARKALMDELFDLLYPQSLKQAV